MSIGYMMERDGSIYRRPLHSTVTDTTANAAHCQPLHATGFAVSRVTRLLDHILYFRQRHGKSAIGQTRTVTALAEPELAGIPATVTAVWPRFRSGDYLVTLEYAQPVKLQNEWIRHINAFVSELEPHHGVGHVSRDSTERLRSHDSGCRNTQADRHICTHIKGAIS